MTTGNDDLTVRAESWTLAAELESLVIEQEVEAGLSVPGAIRPLFSHEIKAATRFSELDDLTDEAAAEAADILEPLQVAAGAAVVAALFDGAQTITPAELADRLVTVETNQPAGYQKRVQEAAAALSQLMARVYETASSLLVGEATRQGSGGAAVLEADPERFAPMAMAAAAYPWQRVTRRIGDVYMDPVKSQQGPVEVDDVEQTVDDMGTDGVKDKAHQGVLSAGGMGRNDTAGEIEPDQVFASEIMDGRTCGPCSEVDGHEYANLDDAQVDYPAGGYIHCRGGARCRGTLVFIFG